ncbi:hypothetical protein [Pseudomonas phage PA1C]|uniref:Uncharacterized protein n=1 Tax=Pseudomonas phage vB_PaeM_PS119XW TaxID=2601632 RepID=A0A5C1K8I8_9CAUD|nr:hypothetical protein PP933_gp114 [Pseudomonas phage vB_PaeM_PS119XW]QBX32269.1 hypothetical protein [Pseudomonas phage PA1C]QEM41843.1 hypothetical protein [Pseudomonas phage vB_PaeM_PS119XW]
MGLARFCVKLAACIIVVNAACWAVDEVFNAAQGE